MGESLKQLLSLSSYAYYEIVKKANVFNHLWRCLAWFPCMVTCHTPAVHWDNQRQVKSLAPVSTRWHIISLTRRVTWPSSENLYFLERLQFLLLTLTLFSSFVFSVINQLLDLLPGLTTSSATSRLHLGPQACFPPWVTSPLLFHQPYHAANKHLFTTSMFLVFSWYVFCCIV